jgi:hypothetical protein
VVFTMGAPLDQRIVDDFFSLDRGERSKSLAWLYGMIATYGLKPSQLKNFSWGPDNSVLLQGKKKPIKPMHPHWAIIFELKKQPRNIQGRLSTLCRSLERAIKNGKIDLNVDTLIAAHRNRKKCCYLSCKQTLAC